MDAHIKIVSINVNGLNNPIKRASVFRQFRNEKYDIILLQETHTTKKIVEKWKIEWGNKNYDNVYNHGTSGSKGVAILFGINKTYKINKSTIDENGRFIITEIELNNKIWTILNIYAPTQKNKNNLIH